VDVGAFGGGRVLRERKLWILLSILIVAIVLYLVAVRLTAYTASGAYGAWDLAVLNALFYGLFLLFLPFRRKVERYPTGITAAFLVALFAEMYGFPLTLFLLSWLFGYQNPMTRPAGHLLAPYIGPAGLRAGIALSYLGILLIVLGWRRIYRAEGLVTGGVYHLVRHPQYLGILLLTLGMLLHWITLPTLLLWPVLAALYYRLAREEEREMEARYGEEYRKYKRGTPMFLPDPRSLVRVRPARRGTLATLLLLALGGGIVYLLEKLGGSWGLRL
jgi:protein-S-isoprenylcysteine O-methyltransferase Ste14